MVTIGDISCPGQWSKVTTTEHTAFIVANQSSIQSFVVFPGVLLLKNCFKSIIYQIGLSQEAQDPRTSVCLSEREGRWAG